MSEIFLLTHISFSLTTSFFICRM